MTLGEAIKKRRLELNISQPQLAAALRNVEPHIDVGMISRFENDVCLPPPHVMPCLQTYLQDDFALVYGDGVLFYTQPPKSVKRCLLAGDVDLAVDKLVDNLRFGKENAITRKNLAKRMGMGDRDVRELVERARRAGYIIVSDCFHGGYYRTDDADEIEKAYWQERRRALSILSRLKTMRAVLKHLGREV